MDRKLFVGAADGFQISIAVTKADTRDIVIWLHGITVDKDEHLGFFEEGAHRLAADGITSVRFDFRGHGESSGTSLDFSVGGQRLDTSAVIGYTQDQLANRRSRLHLVAASFGAPPAIWAGIEFPKIVKTISMISPVLSYRRTFLEPETEWAADIFTASRLSTLGDTGKMQFEGDFWISDDLVAEMRRLRPDKDLKGLKQQVLVFHGDKDSMVPYDATAQACRGVDNIKLVTMHGVDHGFMLEDDEDGMRPESIENKAAIYQQISGHIKGSAYGS